MSEMAIAFLIVAAACGVSAWREVRGGNIPDARLLGGVAALAATGSLATLI